MTEAPEKVFADGGEMGALLRSHDWSMTPLGPVSGWSQALRTTVGLLLRSRFPLLLWWGPQFVQIYNDAYVPILGVKHPDRALGKPVSECWDEIWHVIGPMIEAPFRGEPATWSDDLELLLRRRGFSEEAHFKVAYSPVPDESVPSRIGGVLATVVETTAEVYGRRQLATLGALARQAADAKTALDACAMAARTMEADPHDIPCALFYLLDGGKTSRLVSSAGFANATRHLPPSVALDDDATDWPVARVMRERRREVVELGARKLPCGAWAEAPNKALLLPLGSPEQAQVYGVLVVALSPHRELSDQYETFLELAAEHVTSAIRNARAHEEERERAERLAALDRAKTAFFSNVSHEFRTPLTLMLAPLEDMRASPSADAEERDRIELLHRNAQRLLKLVNNLLEFSRIEAGRVEASFAPTDLSTLTTDLASTFRAAAERAGLTLIVDCPPLPEPMFVDRDMWEKIVLNLLSNAFKFTFQGSLSVRLRSVSDHVDVEVSDTGVGIAAEELPRIFERFHRIDGARSRSHEGSGIGLALVHELVRMHGGDVDVRSAVGEGTTFRVRLPKGTAHLPADRVRTEEGDATRAPNPTAYAEEALRWVDGGSDSTPPALSVPEPGSESGERILVADDNADMRSYVARLLRERWLVETAANGREALAAVRRHPPDLILSDVMMPELDGFALLRTLRSDAALKDIPVILLSARAGAESSAEGLETGADDYLVKPFAARDLLVRVAARLAMAKAAREVSSQRQSIYRAFMQTPFSFSIMRGPDLVVEFANDAILKAWGKGPDVIGRPFVEALPEIKGQPFVDLLLGVLRSGIAHEGREERVGLPAGPGGAMQEAIYNYVYAPLHDARGTIDGVLVAGFDVTEQVETRRELEQAARAKDEALAALANSRARADYATRLSGVGFWYCDLPFDELKWNARVKEHFFLPPDARVTIDTFYDRIVPEDREPTRVAMEVSIRDNKTYDVVCRTHDPAGGAVKWVRAMGGTSYGPDGAPTHFDGVTVDVSAQKRAEEALKELAERERAALVAAEEASRAKDDFLAMLGHELRNPLAPIATAVHLLKLRSKDALAREVSVIERQTKHIARLVDDLLDVARIARGKVVLARDTVEVADLVAGGIEIASPAIENGQHLLVVEVPKHGLVVDADRVRMKQVLANLLTNAAKYTPPGGRICVRAARDGTDVVISVEDSGVGISAELLPQLFDLFVQARQTMDRAQGGLGLGLALVKNLVAMHGGTVSAHSGGLGRGSTFTVRLPSVEAHATKDEEPSLPIVAAPEARPRVLIVDDNADGADMLADALEGLGYPTAVAHDGPEALRVAGDFAPHVALLDIGLPVMDGYELAMRLRTQWRDLKLVAITGYGQEGDRQRTRRAGFLAHLTKPVDLAKLATLLATFSSEKDGAASRAN
jgi:signal transduction histidine kinase/DNA-binding response OmpR family regulator